MKKIAMIQRACIVVNCLLNTLPFACAAGSDFVDGQNLFKQKNYRAAVVKFENAMLTTKDATIVYYCALANQMSNNRARARQLYQYIQQTYPGSSAAPLAAQALRQFGDNSGAFASGSSINSSGGSRVTAVRNSYIGPDIVRVPFTRGHGGGVYVEVTLNGRPITCQLDTGAHSTMIGANKMEELGIARPAAGPKFETTGVGERQHMAAWNQTVDLKLGLIYRKDFQLTVQDQFDGEPLLGQDFMGDCDTTIDESTRQVIFRRHGSAAARPARRGASIDVPFVLEGRHIIVDGQVNGKPYKFYFDTGADGVAFTLKDMKNLHIEIPSDARQDLTSGVGGSTLTYMFNISRLKVGSIVKEDCPIAVVEQASMEHPLLGQSFFAGYTVDIDSNAKVIHFTAAN